MDVREALVIIGVVLVAVILWDGLRRMKSKKANRYRGSYTQDPEELKKKAEIARELPHGGARVRTMTEEEKKSLSSRLNLRERVPMLMDSVEEEAQQTTGPDQPSETAEQHSLDFDAPADEEFEPESIAEAEVRTEWDSVETQVSEPELQFSARDEQDEPQSNSPEPPTGAKPRASGHPQRKGEPAVAGGSDPEADDPVRSQRESESWVDDSASFESWAEDDDSSESLDREADDTFQADPRPVEELVIIHVMARDGGEISGSDLLETLLRAGLRFGPLDIFHYRNPKGQLEFSLANCVQPGTLDPDTMDQMTAPGITLFMQLPLHADMMESFDHMYEMAQFLSKQLGAELLDEEHSTVTPQRVEHYRERLRNFARSQLIQAHE